MCNVYQRCVILERRAAWLVLLLDETFGKQSKFRRVTMKNCTSEGWKDKVDLSQTCLCNVDVREYHDSIEERRCDEDCGGCGFICACKCCKPRQRGIYGGLATGAVVVAAAIGIVIYYLLTHHIAALKAVGNYVSNKLWGPRKLRFIPRSELDAPKITHITEEMDINPYSFFPSKDLM